MLSRYSHFWDSVLEKIPKGLMIGKKSNLSSLVLKNFSFIFSDLLKSPLKLLINSQERLLQEGCVEDRTTSCVLTLDIPCKPNVCKGLGVGNLLKQNLALLDKVIMEITA